MKNEAREVLHRTLLKLIGDADIQTTIAPEEVVLETPPDPEMGDLASPMFPFARVLRKAPQAIAGELASLLQEQDEPSFAAVRSEGPYVNINLNRSYFAERVVSEVVARNNAFGTSEVNSGKRVMIEFSCPNTNKPLHVGHLRNDALGNSVANILKATGADVLKVNLINDRGIHICKSMAAYARFGNNTTPESTGKKGDHFVGDYYVRFNSWQQESKEEADTAARELLLEWESGNEEATRLWRLMNGWTIAGVEETYRRTGIEFDRIYKESETYRFGRDQILAGVERGVFFRKDDGSVRVDLSDIGLDEKVLLRSDGTSVYITQDIGTAILRQDDWKFDRLIYVVGAEQEYHFTVLFEILKRLGYSWASDLFHLSYGMVNLKDGRMKSREGTVVDADDLIDRLEELAKAEIIAKERENEVDDVGRTASAIALGAIHYYLLQVTAKKDMVFDPEESISFTGNTGPYLQYTGARIESMLRKYRERFVGGERGVFDPDLVRNDDEWEIVKSLARFPEMVEQAAGELNPSIITSYCFSLAKLYSRFYHDTPILHNENLDVVETRVTLSRAVGTVLRNAFALINIEFLEKM